MCTPFKTDIDFCCTSIKDCLLSLPHQGVLMTGGSVVMVGHSERLRWLFYPLYYTLQTKNTIEGSSKKDIFIHPFPTLMAHFIFVMIQPWQNDYKTIGL